MIFIKNYNVYIILYVIIATMLSGCTVRKQQAPIEYNHSDTITINANNNASEEKILSENTVKIAADNEEIIFKDIEETDLDEQDYILPAKKPTKKNNYNIQAAPALKNAKKITTEIKKDKIKKIKITSDYIMPVKGKIITKFGVKTSNGINKGINIAAKKGTKILASASGKVIYADYDAIFGNLVITKLNNKNIVISYSHLEKLIVKKGSQLKQGDIIGQVGNSGKVKQPQLHFSIRQGKKAVDPLKFVKI